MMRACAVNMDFNSGDRPGSLEAELADTRSGVVENQQFLMTIIASQRAGKTCLPHQLGLSKVNYDALCDSFLSDAATAVLQQVMGVEDTRQELLVLRGEEWMDLRNLLVMGRSGRSVTELWMAEIVAAGCLGGDHMWCDLGLPNRAVLRHLLETNFASLAKKNIHDMKWKKFFYKQLCEQDGAYVCRAPSCDQCVVYDDCFGPED